MKMYKIEVDEEVHKFLESKAVPFVDKDENSVLRKLLLREETTTNIGGETKTALPSIPKGIPWGLSQVLEVVYWVKHGEDRIAATKRVAQVNNVKYSTVVDKYARQLHKSVFEIDRMLNESGLNELNATLKAKFSIYGDIVDDFFNKLDS
jgi:hypothetical protein